MASSWAFIFELVLAIVEQSFFNDHLQPDYPALRSWSLVCKAIAQDSQRLLFRDVRLATAFSAAAFLHATDPTTDRGRLLGGYVCRLALTFSPSSFRSIILRCQNLYELEVTFDQDDLSPADEAELAALQGQCASVHALAVTTQRVPMLSQGTTDAFALQLLRAFPDVEFLALRGAVALTRSRFTAPPPRLYEIAWDVAEELATATIAHIDWLLQNSGDSLRVLRFGAVDRHVFDHVAARYGPGLHSLTLSRRADRHVGALHLFPALRELVLGWVNADDIGGLFAACPAAIQHLAIRGVTPDNVAGLLSIARTSDDLRCISYFHASCRIAELRAACQMRGVVFRRCPVFPPVRISLFCVRIC